MPQIEIHGTQVRYEEAGDSRRSTLILLHGLGDDSGSWHGVLSALASRFHVVAPSLMGPDAGPADRAGGFARDEARVLGLVDRLGSQRVHLAGHAFGGVLAMLFALAHPDRLAGLILEDTSPEPLPEEARRQLHAALPAQAGNAAGYLAALATFPGLVDRLELITSPTLVIVGESDGAFLQRGAELLHGWIPFSRLVRIPDAGHIPHQENLPAFAAEVEGFLHEVETELLPS